ncbi:MAG: symmetrical bis(5'-nucleosyl)-tetraphosphatase [Deltaproteobacteria bacterium]|nr:symmetrical bis(5'-nucleosyl)-tetraphosphatase [Deltaproteobacteria bacterium]
MTTWAIGDIQGCHATLQRLLARIGFDARSDRLWLVGDLVNRGPGSLDVLRWAKELGDRAVVVLGNHDLHLLARGLGAAPAKPTDTLDEALAAPDRDTLLDWLRERPLLHRDGELALVHAGLLPEWTLDDAETQARDVERALRGPEAPELLGRPRRHAPRRWVAGLDDLPRRQLAMLALTRLRTLTLHGEPELEFSGPPDGAPDGRVPWFLMPGRRSAAATVVFGHWAALGLRLEPHYAALDSGCVWGGSLTALRLDDRTVVQQPTADGDASRGAGPE